MTIAAEAAAATAITHFQKGTLAAGLVLIHLSEEKASGRTLRHAELHGDSIPPAVGGHSPSASASAEEGRQEWSGAAG